MKSTVHNPPLGLPMAWLIDQASNGVPPNQNRYKGLLGEERVAARLSDILRSRSAVVFFCVDLAKMGGAGDIDAVVFLRGFPGQPDRFMLIDSKYHKGEYLLSECGTGIKANVAEQARLKMAQFGEAVLVRSRSGQRLDGVTISYHFAYTGDYQPSVWQRVETEGEGTSIEWWKEHHDLIVVSSIRALYGDLVYMDQEQADEPRSYLCEPLLELFKDSEPYVPLQRRHADAFNESVSERRSELQGKHPGSGPDSLWRSNFPLSMRPDRSPPDWLYRGLPTFEELADLDRALQWKPGSSALLLLTGDTQA